jgi:dolichol-phosphate mannosyltransferase
MKLSVVIPAYNEQENIIPCLEELDQVLRGKYEIDTEIVVVNDNSKDDTAGVVSQYISDHPWVRIVNRTLPGGFGRAIRSGIKAATGDALVIYMADLSDDPEDVVKYYNKLLEGYDCVFGSRFIKGSKVKDYPKVKLVVNRIVNRCVQLMFWTRFNDLTNAFKAYRMDVVRECGPFRASHFNITLEMSLSVLCRQYKVAQMPINWYGRTWGSSNLRLREMGRKYLCTLLMMFFQKILVSDDLVAEQIAHSRQAQPGLDGLESELRDLEELVDATKSFNADAAKREKPSERKKPSMGV